MAESSLRFAHDTLAQRVLFGRGLAREHLESELRRLGSSRPLVVASPELRLTSTRITAGLGPHASFDEVVEHVPVPVAERARAAVRSERADLLVAIGGGSTIGLAKVVALTEGLPIIAVPTTFAGSEATDVWGLTDQERKVTGVDRAVLPVSVVYDADLTATLPSGLAVASGVNALAHCVDSLWAPRADPINQTLALEGARVLGEALPAMASGAPDGLAREQAREQAQYACYLAAVAFASAGSGLHHKLCHTLGGTCNLPHAATHAVVLPWVLAYNSVGAPQQVARLGRALGADDGVGAVARLLRECRLPTSLRELGMAEEQIPLVAEVALPLVPPTNPAPLEQKDLEELIRRAWAGDDVEAVGR